MNEAEARQAIVGAADRLVRTGVLWKNNHGNISIRIEGTDEALLTGALLDNTRAETLARVRLDGEVVSGYIEPQAMEIVHLHTVVYRHRSDVAAVVHAHSPHATGYAVAGARMPVYTMALARLIFTPIPVTDFGPRGSDLEVASIGRTLDADPAAKALLLRNHGLLAFAPTIDEAVRIVFAVEENAEASMLARSVGSPREVPEDLARAAAKRRDEFAKVGLIRR